MILYYVPSTAKISDAWSPVTFSVVLWSGYYYYPHFIDEETAKASISRAGIWTNMCLNGELMCLLLSFLIGGEERGANHQITDAGSSNPSQGKLWLNKKR